MCIRASSAASLEVSRLRSKLSLSGILPPKLRPLLISLGSVGSVTAFLLAFDNAVAISLAPIAYLIPVIFAATRWGIWPATLASIASAAAADFFFLAPIYSFRIDDSQEAVDLLLFLLVALVSSNLASRLRNETEALRVREKEVQALYELSRSLAACFSMKDLVAAIQIHISRTTGHNAAFIITTPDGALEQPELTAVPGGVHKCIAEMASSTDRPAHTVIDEPTHNVWLLRSVCSQMTVHGVIAVNIGHSSCETTRSRTRSIDAVLGEASLALKRLDIGKAIEDAKLHLEAQRLREAFLGSLSHELRSPLAAIYGSASVLDHAPVIRTDARLQSLVVVICDEAKRLDGFVQNLLSATRITAGGVEPRLAWADPADIVNAAIRQRSARLASHTLDIKFGDEMPMVNVDSALIEESFGHLLENAAKYSPSRSRISISTRFDRGQVILSVSDCGAGITPNEQKQLGRKSFRSARHLTTIPGSGLGFWIASALVRANAGTIEVSSAGQGLGTTVSIGLPGSLVTEQELTASHE
jgi:K+-sensing histidine kinase KdpD